MDVKSCVHCGKEFYRKDFKKKIWGVYSILPVSSFIQKKYCSDLCKSRSKSLGKDRSDYFKEWRAQNSEKVRKYVESQKENRRKASLKYYHKNK